MYAEREQNSETHAGTVKFHILSDGNITDQPLLYLLKL
jgi:hypothetical protein